MNDEFTLTDALLAMDGRQIGHAPESRTLNRRQAMRTIEKTVTVRTRFFGRTPGAIGVRHWIGATVVVPFAEGDALRESVREELYRCGYNYITFIEIREVY